MLGGGSGVQQSLFPAFPSCRSVSTSVPPAVLTSPKTPTTSKTRLQPMGANSQLLTHVQVKRRLQEVVSKKAKKKGILTCCQIYYIKIEAMSVCNLAVYSSLLQERREKKKPAKSKQIHRPTRCYPIPPRANSSSSVYIKEPTKKIEAEPNTHVCPIKMQLRVPAGVFYVSIVASMQEIFRSFPPLSLCCCL